MSRHRFTGADAAWLRMERPHSPMVIVGFLEFADPIELESIRDLLEDRLLAFERFRQRPGAARWGLPFWQEDPDFDIRDHVVPARIAAPVDRREFNRYLDILASSAMSQDRPMWEIHVVERLGKGSAIIVKLHHSIADGIALMQVLLSVCDEGSASTPSGIQPGAALAVSRLVREGLATVTSPRRLTAFAGDSLSFGRATARLALLRPDPDTSLKDDLSGSKQTAWSDPIRLDHLKTTARAFGATVNDVLLASMSGALRSHFLARGEEIGRDVRAMVPFNLRALEMGPSLGNRFGLVLPALPVGEPDPVERLAKVSERMVQIKDTPEGAAAYSILTAMGWSGRAVEALLVRFFAAKSSAVITNVPGPREPLHFGGHRIDRIMFWVPQAGGIGLGVSLLSYRGSVTVGVLADAALVDDPADLVTRFEKEVKGLEASV